MRSKGVRGAVIGAVAMGLCGLASASQAVESVVVPLHVVEVSPGEYKVGLEVSLGGAPPLLYQLDTGASGFWAAASPAWTAFIPVDTPSVSQSYGSGVQFDADVVSTTVSIPNREGVDVSATVEMARVTQASGGEIASPEAWNEDVAAGKPPLLGSFFGNFGSDLGSVHGLFGVLPQLSGNLWTGFIVELGCFDEVDPNPRLVIGLTAQHRSRFTTLVPMQSPPDAPPFPNTGLPSYQEDLVVGSIALQSGRRQHVLDAPMILDTGGPTTDIENLSIPRAFLAGGGDRIRSGVIVGIDLPGCPDGQMAALGEAPSGCLSSDGLGFQLTAGTVKASNEIEVTSSGGSPHVNLGLIPYFLYDVMFDVENGVVGFAPCQASRPHPHRFGPGATGGGFVPTSRAR